jgi:hypothetical protein
VRRGVQGCEKDERSNGRPLLRQLDCSVSHPAMDAPSSSRPSACAAIVPHRRASNTAHSIAPNGHERVRRVARRTPLANTAEMKISVTEAEAEIQYYKQSIVVFQIRSPHDRPPIRHRRSLNAFPLIIHAFPQVHPCAASVYHAPGCSLNDPKHHRARRTSMGGDARRGLNMT